MIKFHLPIEDLSIINNINDNHEQRKLLKVFNNFFHNLDQLVEAAIITAGKAVESKNKDTQINGLCLYQSLIQNGYAFNESLSIARKIISTGHEYQTCGIDLYRELVIKGQAINEAEKVAADIVLFKDRNMKEAWLYLYVFLVVKKRVFRAAKNAAIEVFTNYNKKDDPFGDIKTAGYNLLGCLVDQGRYFALAKNIVVKAIKSKEVVDLSGGIDICGRLVIQNYVNIFSLAKKLAAETSENKSKYIRFAGKVLYERLVKKELA